jgi:hypothetical protein
MKTLFIVVLISISFVADAQNLIPNGSFENYTGCPSTLNQLDSCIFWNNPTWQSPDYFNACSAGAALSTFGYQQTHSGTAYAGIILGHPGSHVREYLETSLTTPLIAGECYHFEMYANQAHWNYTSDNLMVYFSDTLIEMATGQPLPFIPQIVNTPGNLLDTMNWSIISGEYLAVGGESYLIIGNFNDTANATYTLVGNAMGVYSCYAYIDDVKLEHTVCSSLSDIEQYNVNLFPNPASEFLTIEVQLPTNNKIQLCDITGKSILSKDFVHHATLDISAISPGIYLYHILNSTGFMKTGKILIF